jgi:hypothetical protein
MHFISIILFDEFANKGFLDARGFSKCMRRFAHDELALSKFSGGHKYELFSIARVNANNVYGDRAVNGDEFRVFEKKLGHDLIFASRHDTNLFLQRERVKPFHLAPTVGHIAAAQRYFMAVALIVEARVIARNSSPG